MAVKIKLKRVGKIHRPQYRVIVADSRTKRDGRAIEELGIYDPLPNPSVVEVDSDRVQYWLGVGAKPTESVEKLLKLTGDWQKFTGEGDASGSLEVAAAKTSRDAIFADAVTEAANAEKPAKKPAKTVAAEPTAADAAAEAAEEVSAEALEVADDAAKVSADAAEAAADADGS